MLFIGCQKEELNTKDIKYKAELDNYAKIYMSELKSVLLQNMKSGGPLKAVNVCSDTAAELTSKFADKMKIKLKRFSFLNRNMNNYPDLNEKEILLNFEELYAKNELNKESFIINESIIEGNRIITFAKPIFLEAPCLNCHGTEDQINSDVKEVLSRKYPEDKARNYKIGDLRGAISVTKVL